MPLCQDLVGARSDVSIRLDGNFLSKPSCIDSFRGVARVAPNIKVLRHSIHVIAAAASFSVLSVLLRIMKLFKTNSAETDYLSHQEYMYF